MVELGQIAQKIRSKNAGPFWLTVDIFCGSSAAYNRIVADLSTDRVAHIFAVEGPVLKRFNIPSLNVVKFSLPRPVVQGVVADRDMHGAGWAALLAEVKLD
jgi:hypothetical protein